MAVNDMKKGFTLIELIVSVSIFVVVMTIAMGAVVEIFHTNRKARSLKTVITNLNLVVESISKDLRFGTNYHCGASGTLTLAQNCANGDTLVSFLSSNNVQITYKLNNSTIEKQLGSGSFAPVTAPDIVIDDLIFYTLGADKSDTLQPKILIKITSHSGTGRSRSDFTLQTLVSQRVLDI